MNGTTYDPDQVFIVPNGINPAVVVEYAKQLGVSAVVAAEQIKELGQALLNQELDAKADQLYTNRAARRARERAERKRR